MTEVKTHSKFKTIAAGLFLTGISPGLGHLYCLKTRRGIVAGAFFLVAYGANAVFNRTGPVPYIVLSNLFLVVALGVMIDAIRAALVRTKDPSSNGPHWKVTMTYFVVFSATLGVFSRFSSVAVYRESSSSMFPLLRKGERVAVDENAYRSGLPKRGDVVTFLYPKDEQTTYIKRIAGIPGDTIEVIERHLFVNGKSVSLSPVLTEEEARIRAEVSSNYKGNPDLNFVRETLDGTSYVVVADLENSYTTAFGATKVPPGNVFVMGDNRDFSNDSRFWGTVPPRKHHRKVSFHLLAFVEEASVNRGMNFQAREYKSFRNYRLKVLTACA